MYIRWTTFRCPSCNAVTERRVVSAPRAAVEYKKCKSCGAAYRTPDIEWQHMTRGQRVGYFLNEWTVAVLIVVVFIAVIGYVSGNDWTVPAVIVAIGVGLCVPFWLWKSLSVRSSIARTTASHASQQVGDIQGLDNIAQAGTISAQAGMPTQPGQYVPPPEPQKTGGMRVMWKIRLAVFAIAAVVGILDSQWKTIDKYFPAVNKLLHAGTPSSEGDLDYLFDHMHEDEQKISEVCKDKMAFEACRQNYIAAKPALADLNERQKALTDAWVKEKSERNPPATCVTKMEAHLQAYNQYLAAENRIFAVVEAMDTPEHKKEKQSEINEAAEQEQAAVDMLRKTNMGNECEGY